MEVILIINGYTYTGTVSGTGYWSLLVTNSLLDGSYTGQVTIKDL